MIPKVVETRVFEWFKEGYEGTFTQYQISADATVYIQQIATKDNMGRAMNAPGVFEQPHSSVEAARRFVDGLVENRKDCMQEVKS